MGSVLECLDGEMTFIELAKILLDDFLRERWGDLVAIFLVMLGSCFVILFHDESTKDLGKLIVGSGLAALKLTKMPPKNGNGKVA